jgi:D-beta-D-heptose 7-phosphate kinase / D-beta-D-heptose 1-phosphate adenosyltransferase
VSRAPLVVVGDLLLDREVLGTVERLCPEAPVPVLDEAEVLDRPGGAGLAALFAGPVSAGRTPSGRGQPAHGRDHTISGRAPREVVLVAAVSADAAGDRLRALLAHAGVRLVELPLLGPTVEKIRLRAGDHLLMRLDRGSGTSEIGPAPAEAVAAIREAGAILVSDYGRGVAGHPQLRAALTERAQCVPLVWDPHPRGGHPVATTRLVTPNRSEATTFVASNLGTSNSGEWPLTTALQAHPIGAAAGHADAAGHYHAAGNHNAAGNDLGGPNGNGNGHGRKHDHGDASTAGLAQTAGAAVRLRRFWGASAVAVTVDDRGAVLSDGVHPPLLIPTPFVVRGDSCGAGDRFASAAAVSLSEGGSILEAVTAAVAAATGYVAAGGALAICPELHERADVTASGVTP